MIFFTILLRGLAVGVVLGISIAAPPGPVNAIVAHQVSSKRSRLPGYMVGLGAATADGIFLVLTYIGWTRVIAHNGSLTFWIYAACGSILIVLALLTIFRIRSDNPSSGKRKQGERKGAQVGTIANQRRVPYLMGLSIGLTNPYQIAWWLTVGLASISSFGAYVVIGFFAGILIWIIVYTTVLQYGAQRSKRFEYIVLLASTFILFGFGIWFLYSGLISYL